MAKRRTQKMLTELDCKCKYKNEFIKWVLNRNCVSFNIYTQSSNKTENRIHLIYINNKRKRKQKQIIFNILYTLMIKQRHTQSQKPIRNEIQQANNKRKIRYEKIVKNRNCFFLSFFWNHSKQNWSGVYVSNFIYFFLFR